MSIHDNTVRVDNSLYNNKSEKANIDDQIVLNLIANAQQGDTASFERLIEQYQKKIYNIALRTMKFNDEAKDMAQEAIIKIYKALKNFKGDCTFAVWVYRITVNTCFDEIRKKKKRETVSYEALTQDLGVQFRDNSSVSPQETLETKALMQHIVFALNSLEKDYSLAVTLRDIEGLSYSEIAKITETNLGTVKSRISRGRIQLQKKLRKYLDD